MDAGSNKRETIDAEALAQDLRALVSKVKRRLREQADVGDLTPSQTSVLFRLEKGGPATTSSLAQAEGIRPQSMGAVIAVLEGAGYVEGRPDPADGRRTILSLTNQCRSWISDGRAARQDWLARTIRGRLSPKEQADIAAAIALLGRIIDE
jgi:DNA-binding MarR family transcriptional regulator